MQELPIDITYGHYVCTHLIGGDADDAVYLGYHRQHPNTHIAIRTLQLPSARIDAETINACNDHMATVQRVTAPHIVSVLDYGNTDSNFYIVMPYIRGKSLRTLIRATDRKPTSMPSLGEILTFMRTIADTLDTIHSAGLTHGALEPRNILIDQNQQFQLNDFGLAKLSKIVFSLANTASFWTGTYTAPEIWRGERNTPFSDQYSLACVAYLLVTGRAPFRAQTIFDMMQQHQESIITPPSYIRQDAPASLLMFFLTATAKRPEERFRSLQEMVTEFEYAIDGYEGEPSNFFDITND